MDNLVTITIPVYKEELTNYEKISLEQVLSVLGEKYPVCFICPESLNVSKYDDVLKNFPNLKKVEYKRFSNKYFKDISGYNRLMLSLDFYKQFLNNDYILIYQLDCYIFRDELEYWCNKRYDYIGAPWLTYRVYNLSRPKKLLFFIKQYIDQKIGKEVKESSIEYKVGNGGLSLRNPSKLYKILHQTDARILEKYIQSDSFSLYNEDIFWSYEVNKFMSKIKIPYYWQATGFSLEMNPKIGLRINNGKLPFGCHAWHKKIKFWEQYIYV